MANFTVGCNTLYPYGRLPSKADAFDLNAHRRALEIIAAAGGDGCEFSHYQHFSVDECAALGEMSRELGVTPWSAHSWVPLPTRLEQLGDAGPKLISCIEAASAIGVQVMVVHAGSFGHAPADSDARDARCAALRAALEMLVPAAAEGGLTIAIENCSDREDLEFLVETVACMALPQVGFNIDTGHAVLHGMRPEDAIRLMGSRLVTTHLQDNFGERDDHLPPGRGRIAWDPVMQAIRDVGYAGMLMIEISDCPPGREPDAVADTEAAVTFIRELQKTTA